MAVLQKIPLFADLPGEQLASLTRVLERRTYDKGQTILHQGDQGESLYIILSGQVRIYMLSLDGHEISVCICDGGEFFGEIALLIDTPRSAYVEAIRPTEVLVLHRQAFRQHLLSNPPTALRIIQTLSERLRRTTVNVEELTSLSVRQRLVRRLVDLAERYGVESENGVLINLDLSQEAIASLVGTTRESANRALSALRDQGLVQIDRVRISIIKLEMLKELAYGDESCYTH